MTAFLAGDRLLTRNSLSETICTLVPLCGILGIYVGRTASEIFAGNIYRKRIMEAPAYKQMEDGKNLNGIFEIIDYFDDKI